jgi:hypothetical protein
MVCSLLAKHFDVLLRCISGFINLLRTLLGTGRELFRLVFYFLVQTVENGQNRAMDVLFGFEVRVYQSLPKVQFGTCKELRNLPEC